MRKAYLITAYDQPGHFGRLIRALRAPGVLFFVHIDGRVDIRPFREVVGGAADVRFAKSIPITWMGYSQVESTLALMRMAVAERCDYYSLLSGSDYPIKSNVFIRDFFAVARTEFMTFWKLEDRPSWLHKIQLYYPIDLVPILNYQEAGFRRYFWGYFYKASHYLPRRRFLPGLVPYGGSHWWSLSHEGMMYVLHYVERHPSYVRFYRHTHCSSEMFFQTILLNSDRAAAMQNYARYQQWSRTTTQEEKRREDRMLPEDSFNLRYMDWTPERTGGTGRPAVLTTGDLELLMGSSSLFARKFDENRSAELLDLIDARLQADAGSHSGEGSCGAAATPAQMKEAGHGRS